MTRKAVLAALTAVFGLLAAVEHIGLFLWGVVWPARHWGEYPSDQSVNLFVMEASALFLALSLVRIYGLWRFVGRLPLLLAAALALPCGCMVLLLFLHVQFLDPALAHVTLIPGAAGVLAPYGLLVLLDKPWTDRGKFRSGTK